VLAKAPGKSFYRGKSLGGRGTMPRIQSPTELEIDWWFVVDLIDSVSIVFHTDILFSNKLRYSRSLGTRWGFGSIRHVDGRGGVGHGGASAARRHGRHSDPVVHSLGRLGTTGGNVVAGPASGPRLWASLGLGP
jgi:hypothetical protein